MSDQSEQPRRRRRQPQPAAPAAQGSVARGAVLVAVAVVIGVLLLRDDDAATTQVAVGSDTAGEIDDGVVDDGGEDADPDSTTTTPTTEAARPPAEVKVLVANGSGVNGAAGGATDALEALGYVTATPANAERLPATIVYYTTGFQAEAEALAAAIGAGEDSVTPMPAVAPVDDLQLANVLVHLGPDLAAG
jgi:hypothetical protein